MGLGKVIFKGTVPDAEMFERFFGEGYESDIEIDLDSGEVDLAESTDKPWNGSASRFTDEQYRRSTLVCTDGGKSPKTNCKLPVREPDGTINVRALSAAAAALSGARGGVQLSSEQRRSAMSKLRGLFRRVGKEAPGSLKRMAELPETTDLEYPQEESDVYLTPLNDETEFASEAELATDGKVRFWKQMLPYRRFTYDKGGVKKVVDVTREMAEKIASNFGKAPEFVPLLMVNKGDAHADGPANTAGQIERVEVRDDGLYGLCAVDDTKAGILQKFPKMGISVGLNDNYTRRSDGKRFGPIVFHGAVTPRPYLHGMKPWELVLATQVDPTEVINLAESDYEEPATEEDERGGSQLKLSVKDGRIVILDDEGNELELSDADRQRLTEELTPESESGPTVAQLSEQLSEERRERREDRNAHRMANDYRTVAPAVRKQLLPLINLAESELEAQEITLGEGENATQVKAAEALWGIADYMKANHAIKFGEEGTGEETPEVPEDVSIADAADALAKEKDISYAEALLEVQFERGAEPPSSAATDAA